MHSSKDLQPTSRRQFLRAVAASSVVFATPAWASPQPDRTLAFAHLHTGERLTVTYFADNNYDETALAAINRVLRDFRTDEVFPIRTALLDQLHRIHAVLGSKVPFQVISAYRSPATNDMLHRSTSGVASHSLHMEGMAIDVRLADTPTHRLRDVAANLKLGGVGYYASSDFVHLDIGRPRHW